MCIMIPLNGVCGTLSIIFTVDRDPLLMLVLDAPCTSLTLRRRVSYPQCKLLTYDPHNPDAHLPTGDDSDVSGKIRAIAVKVISCIECPCPAHNYARRVLARNRRMRLHRFKCMLRRKNCASRVRRQWAKRARD